MGLDHAHDAKAVAKKWPNTPIRPSPPSMLLHPHRTGHSNAVLPITFVLARAHAAGLPLIWTLKAWGGWCWGERHGAKPQEWVTPCHGHSS